MMDPAQLDRCDYNWNISLIVIGFSFSVCLITVLLRYFTMRSLLKPIFTWAEKTMFAAFVTTLHSEEYSPYLMKL